MFLLNKNKLLLPVAILFANASFADDAPHILKTVTTYSSAITDRFDSAQQNPSSSTFISGEDIDDQHAKNIQEILRGIPGITSDSYGDGDGIKIKIRGIDNQRYYGEQPGVAIVIDGVPIFERTGKVNIDLDNIESIRVVKGGASYLYGEDALAGAVIITTKGAKDKNDISLGYEQGSFGYNKELLSANFSQSILSGRFQYSKRETDGYHYLSNRDSESYSLNFNLNLSDNSNLKFNYEGIDLFRDGNGYVKGVTQAKDDPKARNATRGYTRNTYADLERFNLTYTHDFSDTGSFSLIGYQFKDETSYWSAPVRFDGLGKPVPNSSYDAYANITNYEQTQRGVKLEIKESFGNLALMGGLDFRDDQFEDITSAKQDYKHSPSPFAPVIKQGTVTSKGERTERTKAAYTELKYALTDFTTLTGNYRFDHIALNDEDKLTFEKSDSSFDISSWRLGIDQSLTDRTSVYAGVSTGFRTPTLSQLSTNNSIDPEHTRNYEIGVRSEQPILGWNTSINGSIFHLRRKDFITDVVERDPSGARDTKYENIGDVVSQGIELALSTDIKNDLSFDFAYTYLDSYYKKYDDFYLALGNSRGSEVSSYDQLINPNSQVFFKHYDNKNNQVPRTPKHSANFRTHWHLYKDFYLTAEADYKSSSYADEINQEKIKQRTLLNLTANYKTNLRVFGRTDSQINAFLKVENATNKQYYSSVYGSQDSAGINGIYDGVYNSEDLSIIVDPGRTWSAGLTVRF
jgi:iron complex outermembrane receptor protein